ncbi:MAG: hypothetical protein KBD10_01820 [Candidatus Pacebacteria bacterium]|nr:hypothetical protein [Candidatus Paceibacterota bacterium]
MIFIENRLENKIIDKLSKGSILSPDLISIVSKENNVSDQGVYKALSFLVKNEIVTKNKKLVSLNNFWIERLKSFTNNLSEKYGVNDFDDFFLLEDKEKLVYQFKNTLKLDIHWMHIVLMMMKRFKDYPLVIYNPHCWFMLERPVTELEFFEWLEDNDRRSFFLIGGDTKLDKIIKNKIETENIRVETDKEDNFPREKYVSVIGDYIIYTIYGLEFNNKIDDFFDAHSQLDKNTIEYFKSVMERNNKSKIIIERNKSKAIKLSKQITKNHFVPLEIKKIIFE